MTTNELNKLFKERLSVEMPKDFYQLWQFCKNIKPDRPEGKRPLIADPFCKINIHFRCFC